MSVEKAFSPPLDRDLKPKLIPTVPCLTQPAPFLSSRGKSQKTGTPKTGPPGHEPPLHTKTGVVRNSGRRASETLPHTSLGKAEEQQVRARRSDPDCSSFKLPGYIRTEQPEPEVTMTLPPPLSETTAVTVTSVASGLQQGKLLAVTVPKLTTDDSHSPFKHVNSTPVSLQRYLRVN